MYVNAYVIYALHFEHKTMDAYSKYDLKDCYFEESSPQADWYFEIVVSSKSYHS